MLNVRKLKQDFSSTILDEGKALYDDNRVTLAKIIHLDAETLRISAKVLGQYENTYESEIEIDRLECELTDSDCDCPYNYDCQHLACLLYYLEENLDEMLVNYSKEADLETSEHFDEDEKEKLLEVVKEAESKEERRRDEEYQREVLEEYVISSDVLASSPFFLPQEELSIDTAELAVIFAFPKKGHKNEVEVQVALRLRSRSKPLHIPHIKTFLDSVRFKEPLFIGGKRYLFTLDSFSQSQAEIVRMIMDHARFSEKVTQERALKLAYIDVRVFGMMLGIAYDVGRKELAQKGIHFQDEQLPILPCLFEENFDSPLHFSAMPATLRVGFEYIEPPAKKLLLNPMFVVEGEGVVLEEARFFECAKPGVVHNHIYYRFPKHITRRHLNHLQKLREITIPEPLFGTFVEHSMPELSKFAEIGGQEVLQNVATLPFAGNLKAICDLSYLNGELEAMLHFEYDGIKVPAWTKAFIYDNITEFVTEEGVIARNLVEERKIIEDLFRDFMLSPDQQCWVAKTEKKIIEFMTDVIPRNSDRVAFHCPQNLLDQFIYDKTEFTLNLSETDRMDVYSMEMVVDGALKGVSIDRLWDCIISRRTFLELSPKKGARKGTKIPKILVLDLERIGPVVGLFDELGILTLNSTTIERPLWTLANIDESNFEGLPVTFSATKKLKEIRKQMLGEKSLKATPIPKAINATLRGYQEEGVNWLERLRSMFLSGILADDMGLGKTLQAIVAITQIKSTSPAIIICPTSLLYNWKEELHKFNPKLKALIIDGMPGVRKKLIGSVKKYNVVISSYSLLQKDIEHYNDITFAYAILDEAQHIKNRGTRNAKSVKMLKAQHRLILSGTPIENSLEEMWSLFDYLMPGFLSSYDRFIERYVRSQGEEHSKNMEYLRKKVSPFILRRMKSDVLKDLPPVTEIDYHCKLTPMQQELYKSYAESALGELTKLVERDGFDKVQIHVLATLTRLKQICCHPAIFAKEKAEAGDSAKYEMLQDLLQTLIEGGHKTVIFSQYTKMLRIMRDDLERMGIPFTYLDGSSKNRLDLVNQFNNDPDIPVFLISLKAGGTGLNLTGADTVIHYDMWWNPAVQSQATDRVHRIGQDQSVSVYKLVTNGTIEEKIVEMQKRKEGLVKKIVSDDEAITKLTWEDVLELLQT